VLTKRRKMDDKKINKDYVELIRELGLESVESEKERYKIIHTAINEIKRVKDALFKKYLDGEISYIQYKERIMQYFKGENPEKVIANIYKKITVKEHLKGIEAEPRQIILKRNLKKRRTNAIIVSVALIMLVLLGGSFFLSQKNGGITGYFAIDEDSNLTAEINQSEILEDETPILIESPLPLDILEEPILESEETTEPDTELQNDIEGENFTIETNDSGLDNTTEDNEIDNGSNEDITYEDENVDNESEQGLDNLLIEPNGSEEEAENQSVVIVNETVPKEVSITDSKENESLAGELEQIPDNLNISNTANESETTNNETGSNHTSTIDLNQSQGSNESVITDEILNITQNLTEEENETESINATPYYDPVNLETVENQTNLNVSENETNITISLINQTGIIYETLAIRNNITHINLSQFSNKSLTFLAVGTNDTAVVVVNEILEVSPINEVDEDLIKIKEYVEGTIFEFLLNITFVDREIYLDSIRDDELANISVELNETIGFNKSEGLENISDILNNTEEITKNQSYITPVTLIPFQGIEIDLINATNASANNNGFLETAVRGIDTKISNNTLLLSYNYPEQTQDFIETMKIYLIKEEGVETYYLNITLRSAGIFKSKIGSIATTNRTVYINAYDFLEGGACNINCTNEAINVMDLGNCNFLIENQRSVPIIDYCYLESDFEGEKVRQYFDLSLSVLDMEFSETQIISDNTSLLAAKEVLYTKELSLPIQFEEQKAMILDGNQNTASFDTKISPDNYEIVLLYETEIDNQTYKIAEIAQEVNLSVEGFGITGAFIGASRFFSSISDFLTDVIMAIIRFFGGGITGRFAEEISEETITDKANETLPDENNEIAINSIVPDGTYNGDSISTSPAKIGDEGIHDESEINTAPVASEDTNYVENTSIANEQNAVNEEINESITTLENSEENASQTLDLNATEENIGFQNTSNDNLSNETYNVVDLNQSLDNTTIDYQESNIENETNLINESILEESLNQTDYNETEINDSLESDQNITLDNIENNTIDNELNTSQGFENLISTPTPYIEEGMNESIEEVVDEPKEKLNLENLNGSTNQTALAIESIKERLSKEIENLEIYSRYDSRNKSIIIYYKANSTFEGLDTTKLKIAVRYYADKISYTQNVTNVNEFVDQYVISIENPYLFDFDGMQLTIDLNTTKNKFYSKGHFAKPISDFGTQKRVLLSNINLQKASENIILLEASSPTFEFERNDLGEITKVNIFNYLQGELELIFINYNENIEPKISFECANNSLIPMTLSNNSYIINLEACEGSNLTITANKKEVKGAYGKLLGYYTYIDLSSVILKIPENIFLRSNCDDCVVESLCNPATFCPQSNVGLKDWSFVTDLEFNVSDTEDMLLNSAIKSAELCLYNIYSGDLEGSTLSLAFTNSTNCSKVSLEDDIKALLQSQNSKEFKTNHMILESQNISSNSSKWVCIDVKDVILDYILSAKSTFVIRLIGSDLSGEKGSFSCFDSGLLQNENCKEFGLFGCSPYLNITYEYLD